MDETPSPPAPEELEVVHRTGVRFQESVRESIYCSGRHVGWAATVLQDRRQKEQFLFSGGALDASPLFAVRVAKFEVLERVLAAPAVQAFLYPRRTHVKAYHFGSGTESYPIAASTVLLTGKPSVNETSFRNGNDATGLAIGVNREAAISHAICELLERHLLAKAWYHPDARISPIEFGFDKIFNFKISRYTILSEVNYPFCISIITNTNKDILVGGAAFRQSVQQAVFAADAEATIQLENLALGDRGAIANSPDTLKLFETLNKRSSSSERWYHLQSKLSGKPKELDQFGRQEMNRLVSTILPSPDDLLVCTLHEDDQVSLIRALHPHASGKRGGRAARTDGVPVDPFC